MGTEQTRNEKIRWIRNKLESHFSKHPTKSMSKEKLLSGFVLATSSTKRTGEELLRVISMIDLYKVEGDEITKK